MKSDLMQARDSMGKMVVPRKDLEKMLTVLMNELIP